MSKQGESALQLDCRMNINEILLALEYQKKYKYFNPEISDFFKELQILRSENKLQFKRSKELESQRERFLLLAEKNIQFTYPGHSDYPKSFMRMNEPPFLISYIGSPIWQKAYGLAVVGSREVSNSYLWWMEEHLMPLIQKNFFYTISGGARGVDQKAHALSLRSRKPTVAFLPSGLGKIYPNAFTDWVSPIVECGGAIVSEYDFDTPMKKHHFQARNRLIAGLGVCTLIVQASRKSGSMITARQTLQHGKTVLILPAHPMDTKSLGNLDLFCEGATPIRDSQDLELVWNSECGSISSHNIVHSHYI